RVHPAGAVGARAADAFGVVVPLVTAAVIEERLNPQPPTEQVPARRNAAEVAWLVVAQENIAVADEDLVPGRVGPVRDQPVAVLVLPSENGVLEEPVDRVPFGDPRRRTLLCGRAAQGNDLIVVR